MQSSGRKSATGWHSATMQNRGQAWIRTTYYKSSEIILRGFGSSPKVISMKRTSPSRAKRVPETNLRIKLFDAEEGFIGEFEINPSVKNPTTRNAVGRPG